MVSLKKLHVWMCTPIQRLKCLAAIADTCQGSKSFTQKKRKKPSPFIFRSKRWTTFIDTLYA
jgi:hypothetical protein